MPEVFSIDPETLYRFRVGHTARVLGEQQYVLGAGNVTVATEIPVLFEVEEVAGDFELAVPGLEAEAVGRYGQRWGEALGGAVLGDPGAMAGLHVAADYGDLVAVLPGEVLLTCPALAAGLSVAALAHRGRRNSIAEVELAEKACAAIQVAADQQDAARYYSDVLLGVSGGAAYVEPHGERINVQTLLPPQSFLLAVKPGLGYGRDVYERDQGLRRALLKVAQSQGSIVGDAGMESLFAMGEGELNQDQVTMLYGLMRVRQMIDGYMEHLGEPFVDNDRLAEICDEESDILVQYFGFDASPYEAICERAGEEGAIGMKFSYAFGAYPAVLIMCPGRRREVVSALSEEFCGAFFLPINVQPTGLLRA